MKKDTLKNYTYIGIRTLCDDENYNVGDTCRNSFDWDFENDISTASTDNPIELNGACAVHVNFVDYDLDEISETEITDIINSVKCNYCGETRVLIGSTYMDYGNDENEIIMEDAEVLAIL